MFDLLDFDSIWDFYRSHGRVRVERSGELLGKFFLCRSPSDESDTQTHWQKVKFAPAGSCVTVLKELQRRCRSAPPRSLLVKCKGSLLVSHSKPPSDIQLSHHSLLGFSHFLQLSWS